MKFVIVGGGSMGKRRIRCLIANNIPSEALRLVETRPDRREEVKDKYQVESFVNLGEALAWDPDAVIVSVPGAYHMEVCLAAARAGRHFFCEVPLATGLDGLDELVDLVAKNGLVAAPGCQPPFHPLMKQVKDWLADPAFDPVLVFNQEFGQYLPDWHPHEDYRKFYAASQKMGGGNLDVIAQEMTLLYWFLGDRIQRVCGWGGHLSRLEIEANDYWQIIGQTRGAVAVTLQYDLLRRAGYSSSRFISEAGIIELALTDGFARRYLAATKQWETVTPPPDFNYEQCYIDEIALFLECIRGRGQWHNPLPTAIHVVRFLTAMLTSHERQQWMEIEA